MLAYIYKRKRGLNNDQFIFAFVKGIALERCSRGVIYHPEEGPLPIWSNQGTTGMIAPLLFVKGGNMNYTDCRKIFLSLMQLRALVIQSRNKNFDKNIEEKLKYIFNYSDFIYDCICDIENILNEK